MHLWLKDNLPLTTVRVSYQGAAMDVSNVLVDTGSGATVISADVSSKIGTLPSEKDVLYSIRGVGGTEVVFARKVDYLEVGERNIPYRITVAWHHCFLLAKSFSIL